MSNQSSENMPFNNRSDGIHYYGSWSIVETHFFIWTIVQSNELVRLKNRSTALLLSRLHTMRFLVLDLLFDGVRGAVRASLLEI